MDIRLTAVLVVVLGGAAALALSRGVESPRVDALREATSGAREPASNGAEALPEGHPALPPGHPPVGAPAVASAAPPNGEAGDDLEWKVPSAFTLVPSPSAMRLATYKYTAKGGGEAEISVTRAGGSAEANAKRWVGQFEVADGGTSKTTTRSVNGLSVVTVEVEGTYAGMGSMGGAPDPKPGWALYGVIVATGDLSYFFKMTGPDAAVRAGKAPMQELVASLKKKP